MPVDEARVVPRMKTSPLFFGFHDWPEADPHAMHDIDRFGMVRVGATQPRATGLRSEKYQKSCQGQWQV